MLRCSYPPVIKHGLFTSDFLNKTSIHRGFPSQPCLITGAFEFGQLKKYPSHAQETRLRLYIRKSSTLNLYPALPSIQLHMYRYTCKVKGPFTAEKMFKSAQSSQNYQTCSLISVSIASTSHCGLADSNDFLSILSFVVAQICIPMDPLILLREHQG